MSRRKNYVRRDAIIRLAADGATNKEIASRLKISDRLVVWYLGTIYDELGFTEMAGRRYKLIAWAFRKGIVK